MNEIVYDMVRYSHPNLTTHEFGETARAVVASLPSDGRFSLEDMVKKINERIETGISHA